MKFYDVAIVGGGPAGSAAAIMLARAGCSIVLLEAKPLPHDKLCGEFLSPECKSLFAQLGLADKMMALQPHIIQTANLIADDGTQWTTMLPGEAWGLSRFKMDYALIEAACASGAAVYDAQACVNVNGNLQEGFELAARRAQSNTQDTYQARVVISAHGKRSAMDRTLGRTFLGRAYPLFAMKRHFHRPPVEGVSLYGFAGGYCGLASIENGVTNLCFLADQRVFRRGALPHPRQGAGARAPIPVGEGMGVREKSNIQQLFSHMGTANPTLGQWLQRCEMIGDQWLSVGALVFGARGSVHREILLVGDAAGLIAPLAGDGIAMALRSGLMCAAQVQAFLQGTQSAEQLKANYARAWNAEFLPRMRLASLLQSLALRPTFFRACVRLFRRAPRLGDWMVRHTRT